MIEQQVEQAQARLADASGGATILFAGMSFFDVLQVLSLVLAIACGAFSLYFHVKRYLRERSEK